MLFFVQFTVRYSYQFYCRKHFAECLYKRVFDKQLLRNMLSYSVWHLVGNGAMVLKTHGVNLVLNLFFGPAVNAARGLANQVDNAVGQFVGNFMMAMNPQITQSYAKGDLNYMFKLVEKGAKLSFFLILILALPIILNANYMLNIWLKKVPDYTVIFVQLTLIGMMVGSLSRPLITAQNATGNVRNYQLIVGGINLLNLPLSYLFLVFCDSPEVVVVVAIIVELIAFIARVCMITKTIPEFKPISYFREVGGTCFVVALLSVPIPLMLNMVFYESFMMFIFNVIACVLVTSVVILYVGCSKNERHLLYSKVCQFKKNR